MPWPCLEMPLPPAAAPGQDRNISCCGDRSSHPVSCADLAVSREHFRLPRLAPAPTRSRQEQNAPTTWPSPASALTRGEAWRASRDAE